MIIVIFVVGCFIGEAVMDVYDTWISFNGPAMGIMLVGELLWWRIRKKLVEKDESNKP